MLKKISLTVFVAAQFMTVASARIPLPTCYPCGKIAAKKTPTAVIPLPTCYPCGKATVHVASNAK
jgi:hypothetical protein